MPSFDDLTSLDDIDSGLQKEFARRFREKSNEPEQGKIAEYGVIASSDFRVMGDLYAAYLALKEKYEGAE